MTQQPNQILGAVLVNTLRPYQTEFNLSDQYLALLQNLDENALVEVKEIVAKSPDVRQAIIEEMWAVVSKFVDSELSRLTSIRQSREFTEAEKQYGKETLPILLNSIRSLIG